MLESGAFGAEDGGGAEEADADEAGEPDEVLEAEHAAVERGEVTPDA